MTKYYVGSLPYSDELTHHGVKGMHWYIRLYQNADGSLTPLGKIHYGVSKTVKDAAKAISKPFDSAKNVTVDSSPKEIYKSLEKPIKGIYNSATNAATKKYEGEIENNPVIRESIDSSKGIVRKLEEKYGSSVERMTEQMDDIYFKVITDNKLIQEYVNEAHTKERTDGLDNIKKQSPRYVPVDNYLHDLGYMRDRVWEWYLKKNPNISKMNDDIGSCRLEFARIATLNAQNFLKEYWNSSVRYYSTTEVNKVKIDRFIREFMDEKAYKYFYGNTDYSKYKNMIRDANKEYEEIYK